MSDTLTQEHERTVSSARVSMSFHDDAAPLKRWFDNYKDDKSAYFCSGWCVVTRDGWRWKIEFGYGDSTKPTYTYHADSKAPAPPIFEFRPPPPEPVKPRFSGAEPWRVPSYRRGEIMASFYAPHLYVEPLRYEFYERRAFDRRLWMDGPMFERVSAPPPPPPTRRNQ